MSKTKLTSFETALISAANDITAKFNGKIKVVAVYTEIWKGLSVNTLEQFEKAKEFSSAVKFNESFDGNVQIKMLPNYNLKFPVRIENKRALDAIEHIISDIAESTINN